MSPVARAYERFCTKRFPLPTERQVAELEARLGAKLPADYRAFLLAYNGGYFNAPAVAGTEDDCPGVYVDVLYGIGANHQSAELGSDADLFDDNYPLQVLPIGYTPNGHLLYMEVALDPGSIGVKLAWKSEYLHLASGIEEFFGLFRALDG